MSFWQPNHYLGMQQSSCPWKKVSFSRFKYTILKPFKGEISEILIWKIAIVTPLKWTCSFKIYICVIIDAYKLLWFTTKFQPNPYQRVGDIAIWSRWVNKSEQLQWFSQVWTVKKNIFGRFDSSNLLYIQREDCLGRP